LEGAEIGVDDPVGLVIDVGCGAVILTGGWYSDDTVCC